MRCVEHKLKMVDHMINTFPLQLVSDIHTKKIVGLTHGRLHIFFLIVYFCEKFKNLPG